MITVGWSMNVGEIFYIGTKIWDVFGPAEANAFCNYAVIRLLHGRRGSVSPLQLGTPEISVNHGISRENEYRKERLTGSFTSYQ